MRRLALMLLPFALVLALAAPAKADPAIVRLCDGPCATAINPTYSAGGVFYAKGDRLTVTDARRDGYSVFVKFYIDQNGFRYLRNYKGFNKTAYINLNMLETSVIRFKVCTSRKGRTIDCSNWVSKSARNY